MKAPHCVYGILPVLVLCFVMGANAQGEKKIALKDVPPAVREAFAKSYPHAEAKAASSEVEHGVTYYEIESLEGSVHRDILYTEDGKASEIEESVKASTLPAAVKEGLERSYPNCKVLRAETSTRESTTNYELVILSGKARHEIVIDGSGKIKEDKHLGATKKAEKND